MQQKLRFVADLCEQLLVARARHPAILGQSGESLVQVLQLGHRLPRHAVVAELLQSYEAVTCTNTITGQFKQTDKYIDLQYLS